jgi:hypothetical protein
MRDKLADEYTIEFFPPEYVPDAVDDNVDVFVRFADGRAYVATVYTLANVATLLARWRQSGECASGTYFWSTNMFIVERLTEDVLARTVKDLLETGEFYQVFEGPCAGVQSEVELSNGAGPYLARLDPPRRLRGGDLTQESSEPGLEPRLTTRESNSLAVSNGLRGRR